MIQRLALVLPLAGLALVVATLAVLAYQPELNKPWPKSVILPCAAPKSLIVWMEYDQTYQESSSVAFSSLREPAFTPIRFYVGSESPENLIAERLHPGKLTWGPMALDTKYEVVWRGAGEIHVRVPEGTSEQQFKQWAEQIERCEGASVIVRIASPHSQSPDQPASQP